MHNAQHTDVKCPSDLLVKCEAGPLNKWLSRFVAETRHGGGKNDSHPVSLFMGYIFELIKKSCGYSNYTMPVAMAAGYKVLSVYCKAV